MSEIPVAIDFPFGWNLFDILANPFLIALWTDHIIRYLNATDLRLTVT